MRKPAFCTSENKSTDQLHGNRAADQCLCFRYMDTSIIPLLPKSEISSLYSHLLGCTAQFVLDLLVNREDRLSHDMANMKKRLILSFTAVPKS